MSDTTSYETQTKAQRKPPARNDLLLCDCAECGRECVGLAHAQFAHHFALPVAARVLDRPYCPGCKPGALGRQIECPHCHEFLFAAKAVMENGRPVCGPCSTLNPLPWRNAFDNDRHYPGKPPQASNDAGLAGLVKVIEAA